MPTRCTAAKRDGTPCNAWAVHGTDPPRCAAHGGVAAHTNPNNRKHGSYSQQHPAAPAADATIADVIADLAKKQRTLSKHIDECLDDDLDVSAIAHLLALHGLNASRLGRLLRDQRALSGDAADGIAGAIAQALDELSNELGVDL